MRAVLINQPQPQEPRRDHRDPRRLLEIADRQLEAADMYLAAIENLQIPDRTIERAVGQLRGDLEGVRRLLTRPRVV